jgi:HEAT repeat protein
LGESGVSILPGALGGIGPAAKEAAPELARLLKDPIEGVRGAAATALSDLGPAAKDNVPENT